MSLLYTFKREVGIRKKNQRKIILNFFFKNILWLVAW